MSDHVVEPEAFEAAPQLGRYRELVLLGRGGMGSVYKGVDPELGRPVAIKVMNDSTPEFVARFRREAQAMARLSHPNVVQVYDFGEDAAGNPYFVMEFVAGRSLQKLLEGQGPMSPDEVVDVLRQAALGLGAAHAAGIVHRDIKPDNLVLADVVAGASASRTGHRLKVVDFGIARDTVGADPALTRPQALVGTPLYMAPEMLNGRPVDGRADLYALGLTAYHLLSGAPPFNAPSALELMMQQLSTPLPDLAVSAPRTPTPLARLIARLAEKDPDQRVQTCDELVRELNALDVGHAVTAAVPSLPSVPALHVVTTPPASGAPSRLPLALAAVLSLTLAGIGGLLVLKRQHATEPTRPSVPPIPSTAVGPPRTDPAGDTPRAAVAAPQPLGATGPVRTAVMPFKNFGGEQDLAFLSEGIGDSIATVLGQAHDARLRLVERTQIDKALAEIDLGQTKYADKSTAVALGKVTGAELAVLGGYQKSAGQIRVTARFVRTDTGDVLDTLAVTRPAAKLFDVQDEVAREVHAKLRALVGHN